MGKEKRLAFSKQRVDQMVLCAVVVTNLWQHISPTVLVIVPIITSTLNQKDQFYRPSSCSFILRTHPSSCGFEQ